MTLVDLLAAYAGAATTHRRATPEIEAVALVFPNGRQMILLERTYRDGVAVIVDPTEADLAAMGPRKNNFPFSGGACLG
jgi:hypothetical protein